MINQHSIGISAIIDYFRSESVDRKSAASSMILAVATSQSRERNDTFTPGILSCPEAILSPFFESDKHDTSLVCPSKKLSLPLFTFLITMNDPRGYSKYLPHGVYVRESLTAPDGWCQSAAMQEGNLSG